MYVELDLKTFLKGSAKRIALIPTYLQLQAFPLTPLRISKTHEHNIRSTWTESSAFITSSDSEFFLSGEEMKFLSCLGWKKPTSFCYPRRKCIGGNTQRACNIQHLIAKRNQGKISSST